jgi:phosphoserine phosphatase
MKTAIAELIEINNRNIERLKDLSIKNETNRFYQGMLTYAQAFNLDLQHFKKLEREIINDVYDNALQNEKQLDLTQGCENPHCDNGKIQMTYNQFISCSICESK